MCPNQIRVLTSLYKYTLSYQRFRYIQKKCTVANIIDFSSTIHTQEKKTQNPVKHANISQPRPSLDQIDNTQLKYKAYSLVL